MEFVSRENLPHDTCVNLCVRVSGCALRGSVCTCVSVYVCKCVGGGRGCASRWSVCTCVSVCVCVAWVCM